MLDMTDDERMQSPLTTEQNELRAVLRSFLRSHTPLEGRRDSEPGQLRQVWSDLAGLGITGLLIDESAGGSGATLVEAGLVFEEFGWSVAPFPALMTSVAIPVALPASHATAEGVDLLRAVSNGEASVTLCRAEDGEFQAERRGAGFVISGRSRAVLEGDSADMLVVAAEHDQKLRLFGIDGNLPEVQRHRLPSTDPIRARGMSILHLARASLLSAETWSATSLDLVNRACEATLACELVGVGRRALAMSVEYSKERSQFGRPIGANQAIKHLCADVYVELQAAVAGARLASRTVAGGGESNSVTSGALVTAAAAAVRATETNVQVHGGIGFSWEHSAHHLLKRAKAGSMIIGRTADHRGRVAELLGM